MRQRLGTILTSVVLLLLTIGGLLVRLERIQGPDGALLEDEARLVLAAQGVLTTGLPRMPSGRLYFRGVVNTYLTAGSLRMLGPTDFAARFPNVVVGALLIPILFVFGRSLSGTTGGLGAAAFAAAEPELIYWSTNAWMTSLFIVVFVAATFLLFLGFERDEPRMQVAGAAMALVATLAHELGVLLPAAVMLTLTIRAAVRDFRWFAGTRTVVAIAILAFGVLLFVALGLYLRAETVAGAGGEFRFYFGPSLSPERFLRDYQRWRSGYLLLLIGALVGVPFLWKFPGAGGRFLYVTMALTAFTVWVVIDKESERYGLVLLPSLALLATRGIVQGVQRACDWWPLPHRVAQGLCACVLLLAFGIPFLRNARQAARQWSEVPGQTWLTEFRALGPSPADLIMSGDPEIPAVYLGRVDYWERGGNYERYGYLDNNQIRHLYTGALRVSDEEGFLTLQHTGPRRTLWYIGRFGGSRLGDALLRSAEFAHQTAGRQIILKIPIGAE